MNSQLLIDAIVKQTTILIAQLATAGGTRTPLADIAGQVFADLARELQRQGVSRKVAADMFGMALRTYRRKVQRLAESQTLTGRSLWEAVYEYVGSRPVATRADVLSHFRRDDEEIVRGVLEDLVESGLVYRAGRGAQVSYRAASPSDLDYVTSADATDGADTMVWGAVYRLGPLTRDALAKQVPLPARELDACIARMIEAGQVTRAEVNGAAVLGAGGFVVPIGETQGWEAAVFDHFQALVTTVLAKLRMDSGATPADLIGGSTYTLEVWEGHPFEEEALGELRGFRARLSKLREKIAEYNTRTTVPDARTRVVIYGGQCVINYEESNNEDMA
ncbi:MAG TPA: hypothetical protein VH062_17280 [Polyangiaceae bacterium]|jgi:hypothetical protein|nr:hypothetical protein [Polyangiaceae bacterium]